MPTTDTPSTGMGGNFPPLDPPELLDAKLESDYAELISEASSLEADSFALPANPSTDEESAKISDHVVKIGKVAKRLEEARTTEGKPYLEGSRVINALFNELRDPLVDKKTGLAAKLTERVGIYNRAKAAREQAERLAKEAAERKKADEARQAERAARDAAAAAQRAADEAAAEIRRATDAASRKAAEQKMREADQAAAASRKEADAAAADASKSDRKADANARAAEGDTGKLSRVSAGGSTSSVTKEWTHTITDAGALMASLGPLGEYLTNDTISQAISRAVRARAAAGSIAGLAIPGVRIFEQPKTNIRAAR